MHLEDRLWYSISHTSGLYTSGYDYPGEYQEYADKIADWTGLPTAVEIRETYMRLRRQEDAWTFVHDDVDPFNQYAVLIRIESLDDLAKVSNAFSNEVIFTPHQVKYRGHLEIYDDYRE